MANNLRFQGFEELGQVFDALPKNMGPKVVQQILRKAIKPMVAEAKSKAPKDDKDLAKSIGVINGRGAGKGTQVYMGPRRGGGFNGYAGHLIEYGTAPRRTESGRNTGSGPALPFMRPAFDLMYPEAVRIIKEECKTIIESGFTSIKF